MIRLGTDAATENLRAVSLRAEARARRDVERLLFGFWSGRRFRDSPLCMKQPLWTLPSGTAHRKVAAVMGFAGISGPQPPPKRLRHAFAVAVVTVCVPLPSCAVVLGQAGIAATVIRSRRLAWRRGLVAKIREVRRWKAVAEL